MLLPVRVNQHSFKVLIQQDEYDDLTLPSYTLGAPMENLQETCPLVNQLVQQFPRFLNYTIYTEHPKTGILLQMKTNRLREDQVTCLPSQT